MTTSFSNIKRLPDSNNNYQIWNGWNRVGDRVYTEILVLPLEEANELLASSDDQFELIVIKVVVIKVIGHQFFAVLGKKESRPMQVPTPVQASREQVTTS